jgi:hypothetical protein
MKSKYVPRQTKRAHANMRQMQQGRKPYDKKMRRLSVQSKYKKPVSHEQTSDSEVPQKSKKRRTQSYTSNSYRSYRRKAKTPLSSASNTSTRAADKSDSSSDYDDDDNGFGETRNLPSTSTAPVLDVNIPSTSTGITANGKGFLFRIANAAANDSDDDQSIPDTNHPSGDNLLRVLRSPIHNNNHRSYEAPTSSRNSFLRNHLEAPPNGRPKPQQPQEDDSSSCQVEDYASTNSNSLMSSTEESSNDSYHNYCGKKRKLDDTASNGSSSFSNNFNSANNYTNGNSSNGMFGTPTNRLKLTPDSGVSSLPTPSPSSSRGNTSNGIQIKKIEMIKRNFRKNLQTSDDDDSD